MKQLTLSLSLFSLVSTNNYEVSVSQGDEDINDVQKQNLNKV